MQFEKLRLSQNLGGLVSTSFKVYFFLIKKFMLKNYFFKFILYILYIFIDSYFIGYSKYCIY